MNILELPVGPALWKTHQLLSSLQGPLKWGSQSGEVNQLPPAGSVVAGTAERFETSFVWLSQTTLLLFFSNTWLPPTLHFIVVVGGGVVLL